MAISVEEFIASFHALNGTTIGERRKNLFLLLHRINDIDFNLIQPRTPLEESFKVQILLHFKKIPQLIEILKSENPILIHKILKESSWFLSQIFNYLTHEDLVEKVFPHISFNAKVKLINKLFLYIKLPEDGDRLFYAIQKRYGNYLATKLLPCCSGVLVLQYLKTLKIELSSRQLLIIIKKHPQLSEEILEALNYFSTKEAIIQKYKDVFVHILNTDLSLFFKLSAVYEINLRLGWRSTNRLITRNKVNVIQYANSLYNHLHHKELGKSLNKDFDQFFLKMLPLTLCQFKTKMQYYINIMNDSPKHHSKLSLMITAFRQAYGSEIWQHSDCVTVGILELMTVEERDQWMNTNPKPPKIPVDVWNCFWKTEKSIPLITNKISLTSNIQEKAELIGCLAETCRINKDDSALIDVCKYVSGKHRTDNNILCNFLNSLKHCYQFSSFNMQVWKSINEIVQIIVSKRPYPFYYNEWIFEYVIYLFINDLPAKEYVSELSKNNETHCAWSFLSKNKKCIEKYGELISDLYTGEDLANQYVQYYEHILSWNRSHPSNKISFSYKSAIKFLTDQLSNKDSYGFSYSSVLGKFLGLDIDEDDLELCFKIFAEQEYNYIDLEMFARLIKYRPLMVLKHIEYLTKIILNLWYTMVKPHIWMLARNYSHLEIPQKIIAVCQNTLTMEGESIKRNCVTALACLLDSTSFVNLIKPYYPTEAKMEVDDDNEENYKLQQAITASFKSVIPSSVILESVLNFSKGDYMKFIQRALHSVSHSASEKNLAQFYNALVDRPVSVRKNVVYLTFKVLDCKEIYNMLAHFKTTEKNASIQKFIFKASFHYFLKNPSDTMWELAQNNLKLVNVDDEEIVEILVQTKKVPPSFLNKYLIYSFKYLESIPKSKKTDEGKVNLLNAITPMVMPTLPEEFSWGLIQTYLFQDKGLSDAVQLFACQFAIYIEGDEEKNVIALFNFVKQHVVNTWHSEDNRNEGRKCVNAFLKRFCEIFINDKSAPRHILRKFSELWNAFLKPHQAFPEFLQLQLTLICVDRTDLDLNCEQISMRLSDVCKTLEIYDSAICTEFGATLNSFMPSLLNGDDEQEEVKRLNLIGFLIQNKIKKCELIAICLLPVVLPAFDEIILRYENIIKQLEMIDDQTVKFALALHFHKHSLCNPFASNRIDPSRYKQRIQGRFITEYTNKYRQCT